MRVYYRTDQRGNITLHALSPEGKPLCGVRAGEDDHIQDDEHSCVQCGRCRRLQDRLAPVLRSEVRRDPARRGAASDGVAPVAPGPFTHTGCHAGTEAEMESRDGMTRRDVIRLFDIAIAWETLTEGGHLDHEIFQPNCDGAAMDACEAAEAYGWDMNKATTPDGTLVDEACLIGAKATAEEALRMHLDAFKRGTE